MTEAKRPLKVFLCHAHADSDAVHALYARLTKDGVDAWLDKERLLPGQDWELEIRKAVREADVVVVCLSKQFNQAGYRQKEVRLALNTAMEQPEGEIFIIPARLDECDNLESLRKWQWVDLFEDNGYEMLMRALQARANKIDATLQTKRKLSTVNNQSAPDQKPFEPPKTPPVEPRITVSPQPVRTNTTAIGGTLAGFVVIGICAVIGLVILLSVLNNPGQATNTSSGNTPAQSNPPSNSGYQAPPPGIYDASFEPSVELDNQAHGVQYEGSGERNCEDAGLTFGVKFSFGTGYDDYEMNLNSLSFSLSDDQGNSYQLDKVMFDPYFNPTMPTSKVIKKGMGEIIFTCWKIPLPSERGAVYMFFTIKGLPGGKDITWRSLTP